MKQLTYLTTVLCISQPNFTQENSGHKERNLNLNTIFCCLKLVFITIRTIFNRIKHVESTRICTQASTKPDDSQSQTCQQTHESLKPSKLQLKVHAFNCSAQKTEAGGCQFKAGLVYKGSARTAKTITQRKRGRGSATKKKLKIKNTRVRRHLTK